MRGVLALLASLLVLTACGDSGTGARAPSLSGAWAGSSQGLVLNITVTERDQQVAGSGSLAAGQTSAGVVVEGTHVHPNVSLMLRPSGFQELNFSGRFTDDNNISGTLQGSGFTGQELQLVRQ
jgi:hypothetical protein